MKEERTIDLFETFFIVLNTWKVKDIGGVCGLVSWAKVSRTTFIIVVTIKSHMDTYGCVIFGEK